MNERRLIVGIRLPHESKNTAVQMSDSFFSFMLGCRMKHSACLCEGVPSNCRH